MSWSILRSAIFCTSNCPVTSIREDRKRRMPTTEKAAPVNWVRVRKTELVEVTDERTPSAARFVLSVSVATFCCWTAALATSFAVLALACFTFSALTSWEVVSELSFFFRFKISDNFTLRSRASFKSVSICFLNFSSFRRTSKFNESISAISRYLKISSIV